MTGSSIHLWTICAALLCALSCALLGTYLVIRRMSLVGDAISHSILPGLAAAFLLTGTRDILPMFAGAAVCGLLTVAVSQFLARFCKVDQGAALGVVFTTLFAIGVLLIRAVADKVDLDPSCVLYGLLEYVVLETVDVAGVAVPRAVVVLGGVLVLNIAFVVAFYKELKLTSFDPQLANALGYSPLVLQTMLMTAVAMTCVASFEAVGSILVVAMFIVPAATARLLTDRFAVTIWLSLVLAALSAPLGYATAVWLDTSVAGMMSVVAGAMFALAAIAAPRYGLVARIMRRTVERVRICAEDVLGLAYRCREEGYRRAFPLTRSSVVSAMGGGLTPHAALMLLIRSGDIVLGEDGVFELTARGEDSARRIVRTHRLWERYLVDTLKLSPDHVHGTATRLEHHTPPHLEEHLIDPAKPPTDPHGKVIP